VVCSIKTGESLYSFSYEPEIHFLPDKRYVMTSSGTPEPFFRIHTVSDGKEVSTFDLKQTRFGGYRPIDGNILIIARAASGPGSLESPTVYLYDLTLTKLLTSYPLDIDYGDRDLHLQRSIQSSWFDLICDGRYLVESMGMPLSFYGLYDATTGQR
jgi:hypothetical protein